MIRYAVKNVYLLHMNQMQIHFDFKVSPVLGSTYLHGLVSHLPILWQPLANPLFDRHTRLVSTLVSLCCLFLGSGRLPCSV